MKTQEQIYTDVTQEIIEAMERGDLPPWSRSWSVGLNKNLVSQKAYRGINQINLEAKAMTKGFHSSWWLTFNQARKLGGKVRKGAKSAVVVKWLWFCEADEEDKRKPRKNGRHWALPKYFRVFNLEECEGIDAPEQEVRSGDPLEHCERLVASMPLRPAIGHDDRTQAYYSPRIDAVNVPALKFFESSETYYSTLFHELGHSTGHLTRIGRKGITELNRFGSHEYSKEELCAESCAAFLCAIVGIQTQRTISNTKAYIKSWLRALKDDRKLLIYGIQQGQAAADYIQGVKPVYDAM